MAIRTKSLSRRSTYRNSAISTYSQATLSRRKTTLPWRTSNEAVLLQKSTACDNNSLLSRCKDDSEEYAEMNDNDLIVIAKKQNTLAYKELFSRYQKKLFTYIYHLVGNKEETEDILQNVFSKTYKNIEHFDISRKFSSWIYRIAHNESVNFLKRKSKRYTISWDDVLTTKDKLESASDEERPEEKIEHQEITREVDWALEKIPEKYQQVLKLRYFDELSYQDMSKILNKPINTVGTLINRAKRKLSEVVDEKTGSR
jgi:RNA polymerase sigma-70 factor (ECF subfamily)